MIQVNEPHLKLKNGEILYVGDVKKIESGELTLQKFAYGFDVGSRTSIINHLIKKYNFSSYLEIGVRDGINYNKIIASKKVGVDPNPKFIQKNLYVETSDEFFKKNNQIFDIIFIDGLHLEEQVDKDINNSLKFLKKNGYIIMHDCNPPTRFHQRENYEINGTFPTWNGTVWKSFAKLRMNNRNLSLICVNCDWGVGIISKRKSKLFPFNDKLNFEFLQKNRVELLNLTSVKNFLDI